MTLERLHLLSRVALIFVASSAGLSTSRALAQTGYTPPAPVPQSTQAPAANPMCAQLESQLATVNRGGNDPARADQIKRYEDAVSKQEQELDRTIAQGRRLGCESAGFFSLFSSPNPQCGPINSQISQMRSNLARLQSDLQRLQAGGVDSENQRQGILVALAQYNCGPQYRPANTSQPGGLFAALFGNSPFGGDATQSNTFRTICVRTCDGYYFPISFATTQTRFQDDQMQCQRMCPAAEVTLYTYHNPGEEVTQAVSLTGAPYTALPNAFRYRQEFNPTCSCRKPGQSWAQALGQIRDDTVEQGDIIVNEQRAKALSQPKIDAQGRPIRQDAKAAKPTPSAPAPADASADTVTDSPTSDGKRPVRSVGPIFVPVH